MNSFLNYGDGPRAIYEVLKQRIIAGDLMAGEEFKIMSLADELDVSVSPLREAVRMLAAENLLELRPRRSPIVAHVDPHELIELNQIRGALEPLILADAVPRHTPETIALCQELLAQDLECTDMWEKVELNRKFHSALLEPSRMKRSIAIIEGQFDGITRIIQARVVEHGQLVGKHNYEHEAILDAVSAGSSERSLLLMSRHIDHATARIKHELDLDGAVEQEPGSAPQPLARSRS